MAVEGTKVAVTNCLGYVRRLITEVLMDYSPMMRYDEVRKAPPGRAPADPST